MTTATTLEGASDIRVSETTLEEDESEALRDRSDNVICVFLVVFNFVVEPLRFLVATVSITIEEPIFINSLLQKRLLRNRHMSIIPWCAPQYPRWR